MRNIIALFSLIFFLFSQGQTINISYNKNIETYFLAEILSADHRTINKDFENFKIKECSTYQPIVKRALDQFSQLKDDNFAKETANINDVLNQKYGLGNDILMPALLYHQEFPSMVWKSNYQFKNDNFSKEKNDEITNLIKNYVDNLATFYTKNRVGEFFKTNKSFYASAKKEFGKQLPKGFVKAMESYYGEKFNSYNILISPMMMWPIEDNEGRGIGSKTEINNKTDIYEIASPFVRVLQDNQYGYDNQFQVRFLTIHEFGHSFVNKEVSKNKDKLSEFQLLFDNSKLKETMINTGGYGDYQTCVAEHLVRLGEIEVALLQHDKERADKLVQYHSKNNFIFLPQLMDRVKLYLDNRTKYPNFATFVPQLLDIFNDSNIEFINKELEKK